jgi:sensor histidine kinase YesM
MQKKTHYIWFIIIAAVLITLLANIGLLNRFYKLSQLQELSAARQEEYYFIIKIGFFSAISELVMLIVFIFYNYSWKDVIIPQNMSQQKKVFLIVLTNLLLLCCFICADFFISKYGTRLIANEPFNGTYLQNYFINHLSVLIIAFIAPYVLLRMQKARAMELNLNQMKEEKSIAELAALKEQISPHFFFNTLSTLSTIVRNDSKEASLEYIQDISNTYRYTLTSTKADLVTLQEELDFIKSYTYVLQKRFDTKLTFEISISDTILQSKIPPMSLQLLVENAIQHNVITSETPLNIYMYLFVENNLQEKNAVESFGIGLVNLNNRYKLITNTEIIIERESALFRVQLPIIS